MSESENKSGRNFAPMPLAVLASDASRSAKLLILALFHHDWDGEKAWPSQDRLAIIMSCSRDTVTEATKECVGRGWITTTRRFGDSSVYSISVPGMTAKEFNGIIASKMPGNPAKAKSDIECRKKPQQTSEKPATDAGNPDINKNQIQNQDEPEKKKKGESSENPLPAQKTLEKIESIQELENSEFGKNFKDLYFKATTLIYQFTTKDLSAAIKLPAQGLTPEQLMASLTNFFSPDSWHRQNGHLRICFYVGQAQKYAIQNIKVDGAKDVLAQYYEPWDSRHPYFKPNDPVKMQMKSNWEASHGPWKPKPDWKP